MAIKQLRGRGPTSLGMIIWLTGVWLLLWGDLSWGNIANGILLSLIISYLAPLPRLVTRFKIRPLAVIYLVVRFLYDVVVASFHVAKLVLKRADPTCAVVRIQTRSHNDLYLTATAALTTLVPGSVAIEALKHSGLLYVHVLDIDPDNPRASLDDFRASVVAQEERLLRAIASDDELLDADYDTGWRCQGPNYFRPDAVGARLERKAAHD